METKIKTKYEIGQEVWAVKYPDSMKAEFKLGIEKRKIRHIRINFFHDAFPGYSVDYFLEGMTSYEGENWFPEVPTNSGSGDIYETLEEAQQFLDEWEALG